MCSRTQVLATKRQQDWLRQHNGADINANAAHYHICGIHFASSEQAYCLFFLFHFADWGIVIGTTEYPSRLFDTDHPDWVAELRTVLFQNI